jgi:membrane protein implicated in regulation of membrane protease activity
MEEPLRELGEEARKRPDPTLRGSIVAAGAVLTVAGLFAIALDSGDGDTNLIGIALGLIAVGAGHVILVSLPPEVRPAGVALVALGTPMALGFLLDDLDSPSLLLVMLAIAFGAQWLVGPARGASILLTLALLSTWAFLLDAVSSDSGSSDPVVALSDVSVPETTFTSGDDTVSYISLLIGIGLLIATRTLDGREFHGIATSAVIVGDIAFVIGVFGVVATFDDDAAGSVFVILAGLVLAFVGAGGGRRFTTWLGGIGLLIGLLALLSTAIDFDDAVQFGVAAIIVGVGIMLGTAFVIRSTTEPTAAPPAEQGWHVDPSGRHQLRWHDGTSWTGHVSDEGQTSTDEGL